MKLNKKQGSILFVLLVSMTMTAVMSFGVLWLRMGWQKDFIEIWTADFLFGCCLSIPTGFTIVPLIKKLVDRLTEDERKRQ